MHVLAATTLLLLVQGREPAADGLRRTCALLEERLEEAPGDPELLRSVVECLLATKAYGRALARLDDAAAGDGGGDAADLRPLRGRALFALGRYEEALGLLDPSAPDQTLLVLDALEALGRLEEAERAAGRAAEVLGEDHPAVLVARGRGLLRAGRAAEAAGRFRAAALREPWNPAALFGLGRALVRAGERERGLAVLEEHRRLLPLLDALELAVQSLALDPSHAPNHAAVGDAERALGRLDEAEAAYRRAWELAAGEEVVPIALRWARLLAEDRGDAERAVRLLRDARGKSDDLRLLVREADVLAAAGRADEALGLYELALGRRQGDPALLERIRRARAAGDGGDGPR